MSTKIDSTLRRNGWRVESRPPAGQALWRKGYRIEVESVAYAICLAGEQAEAVPVRPVELRPVR